MPDVQLIDTRAQDSKKDLIKEMLNILIDEYNCNHQQDLDAHAQVEIFSRDNEKKFIEEFVKRSIIARKSSLMYLCGHPGTGKTSTLHKVLSQVKANEQKLPIYENLEIFLYNAMTFKDVKRYCLRLLVDLNERLTGNPCDEDTLVPDRKRVDEEDLSLMIA